jgi:hypothetical protein
LELLMPTAEAPAVPLDALTSPLPEGSPDAAPEFTLPVLHDLAQPVLPMPWSVTPRMAPAPSPPPIAHRAPFDEEAIVARVLEELEPRVAALLEARVSEALAPALARAADGLIRDSRKELSGALRELVEESLAQVQRERDRG